MTEEQKTAAISQIEEEADKKRRALARRQAIADKAAAIFSIGINTAVAVVKTLPNVILSGVIAGLGLIQAGMVAAKPIPQFEDGGLIKGGQGGLVGQIGEGKDDELILPMRKGVDLLVNKFVSALQGFSLPMPQAQVATAGPQLRPVTVNIGTFIGDDRSLKEFERKLYNVRLSEDNRRGVDE